MKSVNWHCNMVQKLHKLQSQDFVKEVKEITNGAGVEAVMDSVGASTFQDL